MTVRAPSFILSPLTKRARGLSKRYPLLTHLRKTPRALKRAIRRRRDGAELPKSPVFITGCGHSGTSLLLAILDSHRHLYGIPGESRLYENRFGRGLLKWLFDLQTIAAGKQRWVEKTPSHIRHIDEILSDFPGGKILVLIRDGRDVACSIQDRTGSLQVGIARWVDDNRVGQIAWSHPRVEVVRYESLVSDLEHSVAEILEFLGEEFDPACLDFSSQERKYFSSTVNRPGSMTEGRDHDSYRNWQINQPLFDGRGRWRRMSDSERTSVKQVAGEMLIEYGYCDDLTW